MGKITIKKSELDKIIKEEALKFRKALSLKKELGNVEKELKQLNEVEAGAEIESPGKPFQGKQHKANFHNPAKNPHTMMEDEAEDMDDTEIDTDVNSDVDVDTNSDTIDKAAVLSAIEDLKMALNLHGVSDVESSEEESTENNGEEIGDDDQEFEFDSEDGEGEEGESEENEEEIEEGGYNETHQDEKGNVVNADDVQENLEEPMDGKSVVQNAEEDKINDNMEKDTRVKASGDTLMESEKRRMAVLAGIVKG